MFKGTPGHTSDRIQNTDTQKPPAERRRLRDARAYIRPLAEHAVHQAPCLPPKSHRQSGRDQGTPGRTSDCLQSTKRRTCHAKASGRAAETKGHQGNIRSPADTQTPPTERRRPIDARAYISRAPSKCRTCGNAKKQGMKISQFFRGLYYLLGSDGGICALVYIHVDNLLYCDLPGGKEVIEHFLNKFKIGNTQVNGFRYCGTQFSRSGEGDICIDTVDNTRKTQTTTGGQSFQNTL